MYRSRDGVVDQLGSRRTPRTRRPGGDDHRGLPGGRRVFLAGHIQPPDLAGLLVYMGLSPDEQGTDAMNCAWASEQPQSAATSAA